MKSEFLLLLFWVIIVGCSNGREQKVKNVVAFAHTYGLVRWFYPSDEAQKIDWDKFTVYGISEIEECRTTEELKDKLESIFTSIAPGVCFTNTPAYSGIDLEVVLKYFDINNWLSADC